MNLSTDHKLEWQGLAWRRQDLRYPKIDINIRPPFHERDMGRIRYETFVVKESKLILFRTDHYFKSTEDIFELIELTKKRAILNCELILKEFIITEHNTIKEPFA